MVKAIILLLIIFSSCLSLKQNKQVEESELYSAAFCALMEAKHKFNTPNNVSKDTLYILDEYYMDTTSIYYNQMNVMFEIGYVGSINFPSHKKGPILWSAFQKFNAERSTKNHHKVDSYCLDTMKIKFISEENAITANQKNNTFLYSPLIKLNEGYYEIYEHDMIEYSEYYSSYILKKVDNGFEFVSRRFYTETFWSVKEDYMKNIDFTQSYEEFIKGRN